jgi:hypothetical protein
MSSNTKLNVRLLRNESTLLCIARYPDIAGNIFVLIIDFTVQTQYFQRGYFPHHIINLRPVHTCAPFFIDVIPLYYRNIQQLGFIGVFLSFWYKKEPRPFCKFI